MSAHEITSDRVLLADGRVAAAAVAIAGADIVGVDGSQRPARRWDARGMLVLPGIVDLHGDAFERQIMPRPGVRFGMALALHDTDRQMAANGITTAFHAVTYSFEPGLRSRETMLAFLDALESARPRLGCDTRVHLRQEAYNLDAVDEICDWIVAGRIDMLAFNDHTPQMVAKLANPKSLLRHIDRTGMELADFAALLRRFEARTGEVAQSTQRLAACARGADIPMASHDDESPEMRETFRALGCTLSEFPKTDETAADARRHGESVIFGAPNVVRGGSHIDGVGAAAMVSRGLCDVLASDYYYPALLQGALRLARDGVADLPRAWALVSRNPATAMLLDDRGTLETGKRADIVIVDDSDPSLPRVVATFAGGKPIYVDASASRLAA